MEVTTKELRIQPGKIIDQVVHGEEVQIFGMWSEREVGDTVDAIVRDLRKGRTF